MLGILVALLATSFGLEFGFRAARSVGLAPGRWAAPTLTLQDSRAHKAHKAHKARVLARVIVDRKLLPGDGSGL